MLLILFVAQPKPSHGGIWHPCMMQFYSGPLMHFLSGVDSLPQARSKTFSKAAERPLRQQSDAFIIGVYYAMRGGESLWVRLPARAAGIRRRKQSKRARTRKRDTLASFRIPL